MDSRSRKRPPVRHRGFKIFFLFLFIVLAAGGAYAARVFYQTKSAIDKTYNPIDDKKVSTTIQDKKPFSILLLGVDTGAEGRIDQGSTNQGDANSDTIIIATVNPDQNKVTMTSIPRDTVAEIVGRPQQDIEKINAAYNYGGEKMAINSVSKLVNVPIDYYLTINMGGLEKIVDAVGGVDVDNPFAFTSSYTGGQHFPKGEQHLNGSMALAYARMRHEDTTGDYGRQKRQQQVIKSIVKNALSIGTLTRLQTLLDSVSSNMRTNLTTDDMMSIFSNYRNTAKNMVSATLQGQDAWIGDGAYQVPTSAELQKVSDNIRTALGLEKETLNNENIRLNAQNPNFQVGGEYYIP
ncbi:LCP family protein [Schleiferilactobacillus harbinensis]|uniref:LCP family protein n=1 Tax=Schleiferilactobacillus harbinensis TaxID=304207 RepID=UPI00242F11C3|nr:LCP family protein [Schleiferilactobacillus harbinensis]MCI1849849.1 LCP family protein [Schleiferilactobacillus harbinensis]